MTMGGHDEFGGGFDSGSLLSESMGSGSGSGSDESASEEGRAVIDLINLFIYIEVVSMGDMGGYDEFGGGFCSGSLLHVGYQQWQERREMAQLNVA